MVAPRAADGADGIRATLGKRLEVLAAPQEQLTLLPLASEEEWADLDGQEQIDVLLHTRFKALKNVNLDLQHIAPNALSQARANNASAAAP